MMRIHLGPAALIFAFVLGACAGAKLNDPQSFEEFEAATYHEPWEGGVYIVDGDTPVIDKKALYEMWQQRFAGGQALIVHRDGGLDAIWNETQRLQLTYCVDNAFAANKAAVIDGIQTAFDDGWETFADVDLIHSTADDANCTATNPNVVFDVRPVSGQPYLARAFFPNMPRAQRSLLIDSAAFTIDEWPLANIIAHEGGHALGFRHEHTRPEAGQCFEDTNWRALTEYDSASVMHYPQCNGTGTDLSFTELDAEGAAALYGLPGSGGGGGGGTPVEEQKSGSVDVGKWFFLPPIQIKPGSRFEVTMTGTGDPDLYIRFADVPTLTTYDCRPFLDGPKEACSVDAPSNATKAHIAIQGFQSGSFNLTIRYVPSAGTAVGKLVINEILADPGSVVDANADGLVSALQDEMIEIANIGDAAMDIGGATISDSYTVRMKVPAGVNLAPGDVLVLFGGGAPQSLGLGVHVVTAAGALYLNNTGDTITIHDRNGAVLTKATYDAAGNNDESLVRANDLDPNAALVRHSTVSSLRASPGRRANGSAFK